MMRDAKTIFFSFIRRGFKRLLKPDSIFGGLLISVGIIIILILVGIFALLLKASLPAIREFGFFRFIVLNEWNPITEEYGAFPFIIGTLITSIAAIIISFPFSVLTSLFIKEYAPPLLGKIVSHMCDLLAAIPSVIYGMWGIFVLVPAIRILQMFLYNHFSWIPLFNSRPVGGLGIMSAIIILVIMILPYSISITRDVMEQVPRSLKEGAYGLGATRWKMVRKVVIPYARNGIIGGTVLALGRALGETMAVTMVIGNKVELPQHLFDTANTIASIIANEFSEAHSDLHLSALINLGLLLFLTSMIMNTIGRIVVHKTKMKT